ncbi:MAG: segregation/condensation protein A [Candidatus Jorgensenbacteria bacterium]|nr:segregation/condensation protein A [Candidatus Jorgensenbacteria bacterium]
MPYELKLTKFQGPIEKLVELIEKKKLSITELSLAEVTADFLSYMETLEARTKEEGAGAAFAELLADFLVIATRLVLIKSKALLPTLPLTPEEEEDIRDLEVRVRLYQELKNLQPHVKQGWRAVPQMGTREFLLSEEAVFYPPPNLALHHLYAAVGRLAGELERIARPLQKVKGTIIHLKEKIEEIIERVKTRVHLSFGDLKKGRSRGEAVVLFLAMLHLIKSQLVRVTQDRHFSDITIAKRERERDNKNHEKS